MNIKRHYWIALSLCCTLFAAPSLAEEQTVEELPWYEIEVIIFTRDLQPASQNEAWPIDPGMPDFDNARPLQADPADKIQPIEAEMGVLNNPTGLALPAAPSDIPAEGSTVEEERSLLIGELPASEALPSDLLESTAPIEPQPPEPYGLVAEDELKLKTEFKQLQRSRTLQPKIHLAWRQPVTDKNGAQLLYLRTPFPIVETDQLTEAETDMERAMAAEIAAESAIGTELFSEQESITEVEPPHLEGTIRISVNRYLHVELDLLSRIQQTNPQSPYEQSFGDESLQQPQTHSNYRMQAQRRMRSRELHYIDHPLIGVLIKITPYELPKPVPVEAIEIEAVAPSDQTEGIGVGTEEKPAVDLPNSGVTRSIIALPIQPTE